MTSNRAMHISAERLREMAENSGIDKLPSGSMINSVNLDGAVRLPSGISAINSTKDDATGSQIPSRPTDQDRELDVALRNANDAISVVQTAEGAMAEATNILQRMRDLSVQAANSSNNQNERQAIQEETGALAEELNRIAETTSFGGTRLLDGSFKDRTFQKGADSGEAVVVSLPNLRADFERMGVQDIDASSVAGAQKATLIIDSALDYLHGERAQLGAIENRLSHAINNLNSINDNATAANSRIKDTDFAMETADMTKWQILDQASKAVLAQANQTPSAALDLLG